MPITVDIPDKGVSVDFPDGMDEGQIRAVIKRKFYGATEGASKPVPPELQAPPLSDTPKSMEEVAAKNAEAARNFKATPEQLRNANAGTIGQAPIGQQIRTSPLVTAVMGPPVEPEGREQPNPAKIAMAVAPLLGMAELGAISKVAGVALIPPTINQVVDAPTQVKQVLDAYNKGDKATARRLAIEFGLGTAMLGAGVMAGLSLKEPAPKSAFETATEQAKSVAPVTAAAVEAQVKGEPAAPQAPKEAPRVDVTSEQLAEQTGVKSIGEQNAQAPSRPQKLKTQFGDFPKGTIVSLTGKFAKYPFDPWVEVVMPDGTKEKLPPEWVGESIKPKETLPRAMKRLGRQRLDYLIGEWDPDANLSPDGTFITTVSDARNQTGKIRASSKEFLTWLADNETDLAAASAPEAQPAPPQASPASPPLSSPDAPAEPATPPAAPKVDTVEEAPVEKETTTSIDSVQAQSKSAEPKSETPTVAAKSETPAVAAKKVKDHVQTVASDEGQRTAKDIKSELVVRLEKAIESAPEDSEETVTIDIPGDGVFTVKNTKEALSQVLTRANRIATDSGKTKGVPAAAVRASHGAIEHQAGQGPTAPLPTGDHHTLNQLANKVASGKKLTKSERSTFQELMDRDTEKPPESGGGVKANEVIGTPEAQKLASLTDKVESGKKLTKAERAKYQELRDKATQKQPEVEGGVKAGEIIGMGGAVPGEFEPAKANLADLTKAISETPSGKNVPLTERISSAIGAADKWAKGKDAVTGAVARVRAASHALWEGYKNQPVWDNFTASVGRWVGADQRTALEVRDFQRKLNKAVPRQLRQEGITNWIQADGDAALLRQRADASKGRLRQGYEAALTLTPEEKFIARNIQVYLDTRLQEGMDAGLLKHGVDNYVTQIWKRDSNAGKKMFADLFGVGTLNPNFRFARQRIYGSYFEGEQAGEIPKNKTISHLLSVYDLSFNRALSARGLIKELWEGKAEDGQPIAMTSGKVEPLGPEQKPPEAFLIKPNALPTGAVSADGRPYRPIDHWALRDWKWATKGPNGENVFVQGDMLIHPDHWQKLNNVLKSSRLAQPTGIAAYTTRPLLRFGALAKQTKLSLSVFHSVQEAVHALAHRVNPLNTVEIDLAKPEQKFLVDHGVMVQDPRAMELFSEGATGGGLVGKIPGLGQLQTLYSDYLFRDYIPRLKMTMALDALERNRKAYAGKLSDDQIGALTARESNAAFGEQNYRMMGRSPTVQDFLRISLLAPDFLESRARFVGQALKPYGREQRIALGLMAGTLYVGSRIVNKQLDDDPHWDKPFSVVHKGKEYRLRTVLGDVQHLITDPRSFWSTRLAMGPRAIMEYMTGRDDRGIKRDSYEQLSDLASWFKPIPLQKRSDTTTAQQVMQSSGISSKSATAENEMFDLAKEWMAKSTDPKVKERYDLRRRETFPDSPYRPLRDALRNDDTKAAQKAYSDLLKTRKPGDVLRALSASHPFTGSAVSDIAFRKSLTPEQSKTYQKALAERRELLAKFNAMRPKLAVEQK